MDSNLNMQRNKKVIYSKCAHSVNPHHNKALWSQWKDHFMTKNTDQYIIDSQDSRNSLCLCRIKILDGATV